MTENISENLCLIYLAPLINSLTDMRAPTVGNVSLSSILTNHIVVTQNMSGVNLKNHKLLERYVRGRTEDSILEKLFAIGIKWTDCHIDNYLVNSNLAHQAENKIVQFCIDNNIDNTFWSDVVYQWTLTQNDMDLSKGAAIFDFGYMKVDSSSMTAKPFLELKEKLSSKYPNNAFIREVIVAINEVLY